MAQVGAQRPLGNSASDPSLSRPSSATLRSIGIGMVGPATTTSFEKMKADGQFRDYMPKIRPAGLSTNIPLSDSVGRDLQSEIYYPAPETPIKERRFRKSSVPGEIHVHHSLKDQKLPSEEFSYGIRGFKGVTAESCMKAGLKFGMEEYKQSVKERVYASNTREPLGKPYIRGHKLKMRPEGFGYPSGDQEDCKKVVFPVDRPPEKEETHLLYRKTHNSFDPGERFDRQYEWPEETMNRYFRFGKHSDQSKEGAGAKLALNCMAEDDGNFKRTKMVMKVGEDYRNTVRPKLGSTVHYVQGAKGPPLDSDWAYGVKSSTNDYTAQRCIRGFYSLDEQLPDQDLGRCTKVGRRNLTSETRAFGVPSVRTDLEAPVGQRSVANMTNYGDECGTAALLHPQRFDDIGVPDRQFLLRRPKDELRSLVDAGGSSLERAAADFECIWEQARDLFDDDKELVSLDAFLHVFSQKLGEKSSTRLAWRDTSRH